MHHLRVIAYLFRRLRSKIWLPTSLLYILATALTAFSIGVAAFYIYLSLANTVSEYRRDMNSSAYRAQLFFGKSEYLLRLTANLSLSVQEPPLSFASEPLHTYILGKDSPHARTLLLTPYELQQLKQHRIFLIHTLADEGKTIQVFAPNAGEDLKMSERMQSAIAQSLSRAALALSPDEPAPMVWIAPSKDAQGPLFIYTPLDAADPRAGWLGLALTDPGARIGLKNLAGGHYVLADAQGHAMLSSRSIAAPEDTRLRHRADEPSAVTDGDARDSFGMVGDGLIPEFMLLHKSVGEAGWFLSYYIPFWQLAKDNMWRLQLAMLLCLGFIGLMPLSIHLIRRFVLAPALAHQRALTDSEALNRKLVETVPAGLAVIRCRDRRMLLSNELAQYWVRCDPSWFQHAIDEAATQGLRELDLEDRMVVQISSKPTTYGGEAVLLCMVTDVTALKQVQQSLTQAKLKAESASQAKTLFLATMSHEIRTPLYGVLGTLELLSLSKAPGEQMRYLETMQQASATLLRVVNDSLDLSAIEAGHLTLEKRPFSCTELLDNVVAGLVSRAEKKGLQIYAVADVKTPALLLGDALRMRQILDNLVGNAVKFTTSGQIAISLKVVRLGAADADLMFQVRDTGIGITPDQLPFLFDPYFRAHHKALAQQVHGTGLGLSICARLAQQMGGQLSAVSEPGLGTCISFELTLPLGAKAGAVPAPRLAPGTVYVDGSIAEVVNNLCSWLRHWGAMAQPYRDHAPNFPEQAILVESWPRALNRPQWAGKRVLALAPAASRQDTQASNVWEACTYGVAGTAHALSLAQSGQAYRAPSLRTTFPTHVQEHLNLRVLIVEDNAINQLILREQLQSLGCEVEQASNGQDALSMPGLLGFDAVFTDLHMPLLDGQGLVRALRKRGFTRPVIGLTANAYPRDMANGAATGFTSLLCKPFSLPVLQNTLNGIKKNRN